METGHSTGLVTIPLQSPEKTNRHEQSISGFYERKTRTVLAWERRELSATGTLKFISYGRLEETDHLYDPDRGTYFPASSIIDRPSIVCQVLRPIVGSPLPRQRRYSWNRIRYLTAIPPKYPPFRYTQNWCREHFPCNTQKMPCKWHIYTLTHSWIHHWLPSILLSESTSIFIHGLLFVLKPTHHHRILKRLELSGANNTIKIWRIYDDSGRLATATHSKNPVLREGRQGHSSWTLSVQGVLLMIQWYNPIWHTFYFTSDLTSIKHFSLLTGIKMSTLSWETDSWTLYSKSIPTTNQWALNEPAVGAP